MRARTGDGAGQGDHGLQGGSVGLSIAMGGKARGDGRSRAELSVEVKSVSEE